MEQIAVSEMGPVGGLHFGPHYGRLGDMTQLLGSPMCPYRLNQAASKVWAEAIAVQ